ncbi:TPA: bifunctional phosphoribosylaminoimidazolecarboxamide formyltransferase/IMP cyclohydrolase PurH [Candidatus Daviesbacteria bacterium]|nr:MAG: hypothetical protein A2772_02705 [Candidatus Daviesbacteria bacterium RIFCSPHIGHO2_01_FULL_38_8b]OGE27528.1 MAG: hypothetical protein A3D02_02285 [Candidatus Daviesbacteria bacterium RIFCSPHIGHO2_02_FULL_39_41]OGE44076.1 MAG: hypothetical protein A3E67_00180 [Candidatus Daviesbacteria bacterium RIFCSPHIGHO2_12_FULL_38_25]OGE68261.1 MAG: hypothetical protein A3H81_01280 [Candidatus Daviesbacteria bacterium RIFCSPLOWO2_02_FULL_38_18]OGE72254.1 MAG: hypothetical protein A3H18_04305 [Candid
MKKYALLSVYDKTNIVNLAKELIKQGYEIISTGGTDKLLTQAKIKVTPIEKITGNPKESFDGRIKTISFQIESGILFDRKNPKHVEEAKKLNIPQIDVVVCNLYPVENIDVGGPTMIRAAAKNYENVIVVVDPKDYGKINGKITDQLRKDLAAKAFYHLSLYDSQIGNFFNSEKFPEKLTIPLQKIKDLRYGENPHQRGALYQMPNTSSPLAKLKHFWGRELSGTNTGDIFTGIETVRQFKEPAACVIKHLSPCGIALGDDAKQALERAVAADPVSAFGGVVVLNTKMDEEAAQVIGHMDIVACPEISPEALELLKRVRKSMGVYTFGDIPKKRSEKWDLRWFAGTMLLQDFDDNIEDSFNDWKIVTKIKPDKKQLEQMKFGFKAVKAVRSNAVLVVDENIPMTRGIGSGQTSRIGATKIALEQAGQFAKNGILVSDSFFPFDDSVKLAAKYGISVIVEQGGSINDSASVMAADQAKIAMVFSKRRAFRH